MVVPLTLSDPDGLITADGEVFSAVVLPWRGVTGNGEGVVESGGVVDVEGSGWIDHHQR